MRKLVMGCMVAALAILSAPFEARVPASEPSKTPTATPKPRTELGIASWYGEEFQGNATASGEIYDMNGLTAAHRGLPLGTRVKVTNLRNNRWLVLKVNDRGPFIPGRFLDVSMGAAKRLGFYGAGTTLVQLEVISYPKGYSEDDLWNESQTAAPELE